MGSRFGVILAAFVAIFVGILIFNGNDARAPKDGQDNSNLVTNHVRGDGKKGVTLVEYGDFECPACGGYYPIVEQVVEKYKADITFQYRNFPLTQIHRHAMLAHRSAQAASNQNKFWEMYNLLYQNQTTWSATSDPSSTFRSYAESLGLDLAQYDKDVKSSATNDIINADIAAGQKLGANSTPTFILDGKKITNPADADGFSKLIEDAIKAKNQ